MARGRRARGFGIIWALMCVALMGIWLARVGEMWSTLAQRTREEELLRNGHAIHVAIRGYVAADASGAYPREFDDLLADPRTSFARRFLRARYRDPMAEGNADWQVVRGPAGELYGVYSNAPGTPLKQDGFPDEYASFSLQKHYSEWKFVHYPSGSMMRR
ncbi:type II secretion system protein [Cupriavidus pauculus]|uniref:type II secretion system protein n=1 Tax=Cupriavidus pauculus TaxID=82633 RepID=UPI00168A5D64|nr:type II secretion system protein [Cupriavidus pauculus]